MTFITLNLSTNLAYAIYLSLKIGGIGKMKIIVTMGDGSESVSYAAESFKIQSPAPVLPMKDEERDRDICGIRFILKPSSFF
ncbi:hypothetical protein [Sphingobacterium sp. SYP-B4668]|uniref:hypothetical protein n=1 Tax=Sphingobacterium sp. SYP-B4668 TaxID=2996035 RepID=UPI0022DDFC1E|nr:hypothetical protein [Sphingobacterium sp. SYP-B4668]